MSAWVRPYSANARRAKLSGLILHDQTRIWFETCSNAMKVGPRKRHAAFCRISRSTPLVQEDRGAFACHGIRPVPICYEYQVVKRIRTSELFVTGCKRCRGHMVVSMITGVVAPNIARTDQSGPRRGWAHPIRAVEHSDDTMHADWRSAVTLSFIAPDAACANGTGIEPPPISQPEWG